jgi:hypothetical protein
MKRLVSAANESSRFRARRGRQHELLLGAKLLSARVVMMHVLRNSPARPARWGGC